MSSPYSSTPVTGYNANPPPDDGTLGANNLVTWAVVKNKLGDPLNVFAAAVNSALVTAFGKTLSGGSVVNTAVNYAAGAADQGRLIRTTVAAVVVTTPDVTSVSAPFVFAVLNNSTGGATVGGFAGTQTIDGSTSITLPAGAGVILASDGSNWYTFGQTAAAFAVVPQGRLTLTSGTPVITADVNAGTQVFYSPYLGIQLPIPNGTSWHTNTFAELTLNLNATNYIANTIYDVFVFLDPADNATVKIGTGPAWSNSGAGTGARGTGAGTTEIVRLGGLWTNNNAITMRNDTTTYSVLTKCATYVGSICITGTNGQIACHISTGQTRKFGVWNAYNRTRIALQVLDTTASWIYASGTIRQSNAAAGNQAIVFSGLAEEWFDIVFSEDVQSAPSGTTVGPCIGIGYNSTTAFSGTRGRLEITGTITLNVTLLSRYDGPPAIGINNVNCCEQSVDANNATFFGSSTKFLLRAAWNG